MNRMCPAAVAFIAQKFLVSQVDKADGLDRTKPDVGGLDWNKRTFSGGIGGLVKYRQAQKDY